MGQGGAVSNACFCPPRPVRAGIIGRAAGGLGACLRSPDDADADDDDDDDDDSDSDYDGDDDDDDDD